MGTPRVTKRWQGYGGIMTVSRCPPSARPVPGPPGGLLSCARAPAHPMDDDIRPPPPHRAPPPRRPPPRCSPSARTGLHAAAADRPGAGAVQRLLRHVRDGGDDLAQDPAQADGPRTAAARARRCSWPSTRKPSCPRCSCGSPCSACSPAVRRRRWARRSPIAAGATTGWRPTPAGSASSPAS